MPTLHIEASSYCALRCPQCARTRGDEPNPALKEEHLEMEYLRNELETNDYHSVFFFCGNFGDPLMNPNILEMVEYVKSKNLECSVYTHGSIRNEDFFTKLATMLVGEKDFVTFAIDGLHDTSPIYRRGSDFFKVMRNANAFISAGGVAKWDYIVFKHNEHQLEDAKRVSEEMGFSEIRYKYSKRKVHSSVSWLEPIRKPTVVPVRPVVFCGHLENKDRYIGADGKTAPCCVAHGNQTSEWYDVITHDNVIQLLKDDNPCVMCKDSCTMDDGKPAYLAQYVDESLALSKLVS